jgi:predicted  nucleic acid-binding Zn-ribbon protein
MSDTPRTDAATRMAFSGEYMVLIRDAQKLERDLAQSKEANAGLMRACDNLERELDDAKETIAMLEIRHGATMLCHQAQMDEITKQRDALAEALREIASGAYSWKTCVDVIAPKALADTKGGEA